MTLDQYISSINTRYKLGNATEHTFRGDLQQLIESMEPGVRATNEPKRQKCGAPDFILTRKDIPVGFIEAKDIGDPDLDGNKKTGNKEQFDRYKNSLSNLIFTDYLSFHFYSNGQFSQKMVIGEVRNGKIVPLTQNFESFTYLLKYFCTHIGQTITSSKQLAEMMANKARLLADIIEKALLSDEETQENSTLKDQMNAFREILIHDITPKGFADVYAQTIAYGMFAARLHDTSLNSFSRQEAAELIPKSNPFLRKLFAYIAGPDLDDRIKWIVDNLVEVFLACNVEELLKDYGRDTKTEDPVIHFYETFLSEYDPKLRKARGVWYTPQPVVNFIVRAVDDILKSEFNLPQGLADSSRTKDNVHKVQILDPAAGTGTFLAEVIRQIHTKFEGQQGIWSNYVETQLLPRLNGFELLMASYAMAHLKLDILLKETGYKPAKEQRFRVYLTNSLEEYHPDTGTLFASWLSSEANEANHIKRDTPVMVVMGNPPYSGESANKGEWIMKLMEDYKKEPGGIEKLNERNPKWINDDYVKFLRYGQFYIERNGSGVLAFINAHGFLDNPTFRGMRWNLLKTYDKIYIIDLHGNSKKKETCPDGSKDENVFDIQQGVSINLFVKTGKKKPNELGKIYHSDLYGLRDEKYDYLNKNSIATVQYKEIPNKAPMYFMVQKNFDVEVIYSKGILINDLFPLNGVGLTTAHDEFVINDNKISLLKRFQEFQQTHRDAELLYKNFSVSKKEGWDILQGYDNIKNENDLNKYIKPISYRPFDKRYIFYEERLVWRTVKKVMTHFVNGNNIGLNYIRPMSSKYEFSLFISDCITDQCSAGNKSAGAGISSLAPLYLYPEKESKTASRTPNLNSEIVQKIADGLGLKFTNEKEV
jgi:predicted helicase